MEVDVTANESIQRMVNRIKENFSRLDVLCNNAGASFGVPNLFHTYTRSRLAENDRREPAQRLPGDPGRPAPDDEKRREHHQHGIPGRQGPAVVQRGLRRGQGRA